MSRLRSLLAKEWIQIRRDPKLLGLLLIAPVLQLLVLGSAVTTDVREVSLAVRDNDHSWHSREIVRALSSSGYFQTTMLAGPGEQDGENLVFGRAGLILVIPADFSRNLLRGQPAGVQVLVDGADSNFAVQGLNYLQKALRLYSAGLVRATVNDAARLQGASPPTITAQSRAWFNPDLDSHRFMVPALMGLLLMVATMVVTSMALVKEREEGTMEQVIVTPLRPSELIAGKLLPFVVIGFAEITLALSAIVFLFGVPLKGSLLWLYACSGLFLMNTLGLGLLISTLVKTQQQAMMVAAFFVMLPFVLLSGFTFPIENMPTPIRVVAELIPLKFYLRIVRGLFLKGIGFSGLWPDALALLASGAGLLGLAVLKFRKRLD
jgi:ABC-2 type transport system permease protein